MSDSTIALIICFVVSPFGWAVLAAPVLLLGDLVKRIRTRAR